MTADFRKELTVLATLFGLVAILSPLFVFSYRLSSLEKEISEQKAIRAADHDLLLKMDGRLAKIQTVISEASGADKAKP